MVAAVQRKSGLTQPRKQFIIEALARRYSKSAIAKRLSINECTLYEWIRQNPEIKDAADKREEAIYERAIAEIDDIAFAKNVKPTAETKFKALSLIIDKFQDKARREDGEMTVAGAQLMVMNIAKRLLEYPEIRKIILEDFSDARDEIGLGDGRSGLVPSPTIEGELAGAGSMADERIEDNDAEHPDAVRSTDR